ncbi:MAG: alpha/beta hydrolase [Lachnospiraceae bacterium]|nr:alpha/beta hydrolase [Lachnospiraceae bacterium]
MEGNTGIILMIHGGGFVTGYDGQMLEAAYYLVKKGFDAVLVNYRLAPENPFPIGAEDCFSVYLELLKQYSHNKIVVFGGSAGGNLALSTALQAKSKAIPLPACVVAVAPTVAYDQDFPSHKENVGTDCMLGESFDLEIREMYLQSEQEDVLHNPFAAPYYGDWENMMPVYLSFSDSEVLRDDSIYLADKLKEANVPYVLNVYHKKMHTFQLVPVLPEAKEALSDMVQFMKKYTK